MKRTLTTLALGAITLCFALAGSGTARAAAEGPWTDLFNGRDLDAWEQKGGAAKYRVEEGAVVGTSVPGTPNSFLCTKKHYSDFELEFDFLAHPVLNSGVQIRSNSTEKYRDGRVHGYQVELEEENRDRSWSGGIYDEGRRGWLEPKKGNSDRERAMTEQGTRIWKKGEWNRIRVRAEGASIRTWLNGEPRADLTDDMTPSGFIALQVHGVGDRSEPMEVRWKNIRLREIAAASGSAAGGAAARDVFDYAAQAAAPDETVKIVFIADAGNHGNRGHHEFVADSIMLGRWLHDAYPNVHATVHSSRDWPESLDSADTVVILLNHARRAATDPGIKAAAARGAGIAALHYGVEVDKGTQGENYLDWIGGYFEIHWSVNPWWTPEYEVFPDHPVARGVRPFSIRDEWYYHMRFRPEMKGVTPILTALPPLSTIKGGGREDHKHGGNPHVWKDVSAGEKQVMAWASERPGGGRGFGFTGLHLHDNLADDSFRTVLLNGIAWISGLEIPEGGVPSARPTEAELGASIDEGIERLGK